jgi:TonB family protein
MSEAVTDIIVARSRAVDRLPGMVGWSIAGHILIVALIVLFQSTQTNPPPRTIMTISLGGAPGPRTGGMTQIGGRPVQAPPPPEPVRRAETAPAPKPPPMALPDPKAKPQARPRQAPKEAAGKTPTTGAKPEEGSARAQTQNRGQGFGLSSAGGTGGQVTLDVANFCCPEYIIDMVERIRRNWDENKGIVGTTTMKFTIQRDGSIGNIQLARSSGFTVLDTEADRALRLTPRLAPLPAPFTNPTLTVDLQFVYQR